MAKSGYHDAIFMLTALLLLKNCPSTRAASLGQNICMGPILEAARAVIFYLEVLKLSRSRERKTFHFNKVWHYQQ